MSLLVKKLPTNYRLLSPPERRAVREEYIRLQNGECWFCGDQLSSAPRKELTDLPIDWSLFPANFLAYPIHLQHDHKTNMTEGAVHSFCNALLWNYWRK